MTELSGAQALIAVLVLLAGPGGAAWVAVRLGLNGARQDIRDTKDTVQRMSSKLSTTAETVVRLEERTEDHGRRISRIEDAA